MDRGLLKNLLTVTNPSGLGIGDLVECLPRQGSLEFGVIVGCANSRLSVYTLSGSVTQFAVDHVRFRVPGMLDPELLVQAFDQDDAYIQSHVLAALKLLVKSSFEMLAQIKDALVTVHAQSATPAAMGVPHLFSAEEIAAKARIIARIRSQTRISCVSSIIATYLSLSNSPIYWWKLSSGWLAYPAAAAEDTQYVVAELDKEDYTEFGQYLYRRLNKESTGDEDFSALIGFLKRYILYPHPSFESCVVTILTSAYPHTPIKADPAQVHGLLIEAGLVDTENPILDSGLIYNMTHTGVVDKYTGADESLAQSTSKPQSRHTPLHSQVYAFTFHNQLPTLAVSLDQSQPSNWVLRIHVPDLSTHFEPKSSLMSIALRRGRIGQFPEGACQLLPDAAKEAAAFKDGEPTKCITFSVRFSPWKPTDWGVNDINVSLTEVTNVTVLPIEQLEPVVGWQSNSAMAMDQPDVLDKFFDENDGHLEPIDSLELGGDLDEAFDMRESAMGTLYKADQDVHERMSIFSSHVSRTDRNALVVIQETLLKNFWKRMDAGAVSTSDSTATSVISLSKLPQHVESLDLNHRLPLAHRLLSEAELIAGEICALYGSKVDLALPNQYQTLHGSSSELKSLIEQTRGLEGTLSVSGRFMATQYLGPLETTVTRRNPHFGLGLATGYVGVARPFEDTLHLIAQWQLAAQLSRGGDEHCGWAALSDSELSGLLARTVLPRTKVVQMIEQMSRRYWTLRWLQQELKRSSGFFVFKCIISSEVAEYRDIAKGFCVELGMDVEIALTTTAPPVRRGDRVMCTGILSLDPTTGALVLGL